jgi:hypothetical protein
MHKLKNERHDAFARLLAQNWQQVPAYRKVYAPAGDCRAAASRLAKRPDVVELVKSIRDAESARILATMGGKSSGGSLADLGITISWCAEQYRKILAKSQAGGDYRTSNAALHNIEKLVRAETQAESGDTPKKSGGPKVDIESMVSILSKFAAPTVKIVDDQPAKDAEVSPMARNRALGKAAEHD